MKAVVVLDAAAFDVIDKPVGRDVRSLLLDLAPPGVETHCAAVTLAEVCRSRRRITLIEVALRPGRDGRQVRVVPTDESLAKSVGLLLGAAGLDSCHLADAHVVALCRDFDRAIVITSDPEDIHHLAASLPGVRIVTRRP